jgi:signal transduction histidine kinase/ligand-binding sensor domain-containing protein
MRPRLDVALDLLLRAACLVLFLPSLAFALDPALDASQYGHTAWRNDDDAIWGSVGPVAQTADGYLWLGTATGIVRFDGVRTLPWRPPEGSALPDERVRALLGARDGALWIGTNRGLASWKDGVFVTHKELAGTLINALTEDAAGTVWVGGSVHGHGVLCALRRGGNECHGESAGLDHTITSLHIDRTGVLWIGSTNRVWRWGAQPAESYALPARMLTLRTMVSSADGSLLVATSKGLFRVHEGRLAPFELPAKLRDVSFSTVLCDRDGGLWLALSDRGLVHVHQGRIDTLDSAASLSGDYVLSLFEDREGGIWVTTTDGFDHFRVRAAATYSRSQGILGRVTSVLPARDGTVWISTSAGLYRLQRGEISRVAAARPSSLFEDTRARIWLLNVSELKYVERDRMVNIDLPPGDFFAAVAEDASGNVWIAYRSGELVRMRPDGRLERADGQDLGGAGNVSTLASDPRDGAMWVGTWTGRIVKVLRDKRLVDLNLNEDNGYGAVNHIRVDANGSAWAAMRAGLHRIRDGRVVRFDTASGLPCDAVFATAEIGASVWAYTTCGLVEIPKAQLDAWVGSPGAGLENPLKVRVLDHWDGVGRPTNVSMGQTGPLTLYTPKLSVDGAGRMWLAMGNGFSVIDPARIPFNTVPPPVHIEQLASDGKVYPSGTPTQLPSLQRDLKIDYTALSLTVPQKVRFRYRLEGRDEGWQDAGSRRQAFYTDLPPGRYRFRVTAANESGVWNEGGDSLEFTIAAAWWQTGLFRLACVLLLAAALYGAYRLRMSHLAREIHMTLDARVNERLRIARELHDTLLQSFQGLLVRLQTALQLWPGADARRILEKTLDQAADAVKEGREAVQGLRDSTSEGNDLAESIRALGETLGLEHAGPVPPSFAFEVRGVPRELHPLLRDEVFRIAAEALRNAFHHARAARIEVVLHYEERHLRLRVRDDGKGLEEGTLARGGREGHFGLGGMRERSHVIGGKLAVWSRPWAGTEIELTVPLTQLHPAQAESA